MSCRIVILGDSSSSGIGLGRCCYPAKLARHLHDLEVHISNCAVPGLTSADASRFFYTVLASQHSDYIIIYLGNNEGAASVHKGYYKPPRARLAERFSRQSRRQFRPILSPARFRFRYDIPRLTSATTPREFQDNLRSIVNCATEEGTRVIIINPIANHNYPCGVGAINSSYFCYLDDYDQLGYESNNEPIDETSETLTAGLRHFLSGHWDEARKTWEPLAGINNAAGFIAKHNLACARARLGDNASEGQLRTLLGEYDNYDSTILYNLAQLKRWQGGDKEANDLLELALEKDASIYRIRQEYREAIGAFPSTNGVRILDLQPIMGPSDFIDYCHPTDEGHDKIARALAHLIRPDAHRASTPEGSFYQVVLPTPNYLSDPGQTILDYYCIDWPIGKEKIARVMAAIGPGGDNVVNRRDNDLVECVRNFFLVNSRHPIFTENMKLVGSWMPRSHEILSFPEFFQYRILYNYSLAFEEASIAQRLSSGSLLEEVRFAAADYERIILRTTHDSLETDLDLRREYYDSIMKNIRQKLLGSDRIFRVMIGERVRTILTWYTRESFRYGSQSRLSMLYSRWDIEELIEGLTVAAVIASKVDDRHEFEILDRLFRHILDLLRVHEEYVRVYHEDGEAFSVFAYESALADIRYSIKEYVDSLAN